VDFSELKGDFARPPAAVGDLRVSNLMLAQVAGRADLGGYDLSLPEGAVDADGNVTAKLVEPAARWTCRRSSITPPRITPAC
jgi:hypothetical protein